MNETIRCVGLGVHEDLIVIGVATEGEGEAEIFSKIPNDWLAPPKPR